MILRKQETAEEGEKLVIIHETKEQQHSFNFPYQVGTNGDNPNKGDATSHTVEHGDIIIVGTDGLWDNMYRKDIV